MKRAIIWKIFLFFILISPLKVQAQETIRVAFIPQQEGFYKMDENGNYSGYNVDFLHEVAEYTQWSYEFVLIDEGWDSYPIGKEMLLNGEIDLLGPMFLSDEQAHLFQYGEKNNGITRHTLCTLPSTGITQDNYFLQDCITVALVKGDESASEAFFHLMEINNCVYDVSYVESSEEALLLLENRQVDTMMSMDVSTNSGILYVLDTVNPTPFYFISSGDRGDLIQKLDDAVGELEVAEPTLHQRLREKYFSYAYEEPIALSIEEQRALEDFDYFRVGLLRNQQPYQFFESGEAKGISVEILDRLSDIIGVEFSYVWVESQEEMMEKMSNGELDLCATLPFDYQLSTQFGITLTRPYLTSGVLWLHQNDEDGEVEYFTHYVTGEVENFKAEDLTVVTDIEETIKELSKNGEISLFCDPYFAQYYIQKLGILNVNIQSVGDVHSEITLGVASHMDVTIVGLLNRSILYLDPYEMDEIIYRNVTVADVFTMEMFMRENANTILFWVICLASVVVLALIYHARKLRTISRKDGLTKLYNSGYFHQFAEEKTKKSQCGALILFDIDLFKQVNDTHGHQTGDAVIISVADNVARRFRDMGMVARLGGDEFVALLEGDGAELQSKCEDILAELQVSVENVPITLSIGGVSFQEPTPYPELYRKADECLYQVKENGRNGVLIESK